MLAYLEGETGLTVVVLGEMVGIVEVGTKLSVVPHLYTPGVMIDV
jgi:hypothetical protein